MSVSPVNVHAQGDAHNSGSTSILQRRLSFDSVSSFDLTPRSDEYITNTTAAAPIPNGSFHLSMPLTVRVIGAPFSDGQLLDGVSLCPEHMRKANIKGCIQHLNWRYEDNGDLSISDFEVAVNNESRGSAITKKKKYSEYYSRKKITNSARIGYECGKLFRATKQAALDRVFSLTIGGDHAIASGSISGMLAVYPHLRVVWVDAHGDINVPETSPSGNYHGMPVAHMLGLFRKKAKGFKWRSKDFKFSDEESCSIGGSSGSISDSGSNEYLLNAHNVVYIGLRNIDELEKSIIHESGIKSFTMKDIDKNGIGQVMEEAISYLFRNAVEHPPPTYLSFDIDACDPSIAPGTGTKARGGLTYREAHYICERLSDSKALVGMDLVEIDPVIEMDRQNTSDKGNPVIIHGDNLPIRPCTTATVRLGIELVASVLGKAIL